MFLQTLVVHGLRHASMFADKFDGISDGLTGIVRFFPFG